MNRTIKWTLSPSQPFDVQLYSLTRLPAHIRVWNILFMLWINWMTQYLQPMNRIVVFSVSVAALTCKFHRKYQISDRLCCILTWSNCVCASMVSLAHWTNTQSRFLQVNVRYIAFFKNKPPEQMSLCALVTDTICRSSGSKDMGSTLWQHEK